MSNSPVELLYTDLLDKNGQAKILPDIHIEQDLEKIDGY